MKWCVCCLTFLLLCGCAARPVWETVDDLEPAAAESACEIVVSLPEQAVEVASRAGETLYEAGELEVMTTSFVAADLDAAVKALSGYAADRLTIIRTERDGLPEYRFAWYSETEQGGRLYRADLRMDDMQCYAVVCSAPETDAAFADRCSEVFSSFTLVTPELV